MTIIYTAKAGYFNYMSEDDFLRSIIKVYSVPWDSFGALIKQPLHCHKTIFSCLTVQRMFY